MTGPDNVERHLIKAPNGFYDSSKLGANAYLPHESRTIASLKTRKAFEDPRTSEKSQGPYAWENEKNCGLVTGSYLPNHDRSQAESYYKITVTPLDEAESKARKFDDPFDASVHLFAPEKDQQTKIGTEVRTVEQHNKVVVINDNENETDELMRERVYTWIAPMDGGVPLSEEEYSEKKDSDISDDEGGRRLRDRESNLGGTGSDAPVPAPEIVYAGPSYDPPVYGGRLLPTSYVIHAIEVHQFVQMPTVDKQATALQPWFERAELDPHIDTLFGVTPLPWNPSYSGMIAPGISPAPAFGRGSLVPTIPDAVCGMHQVEIPTVTSPFRSLLNRFQTCTVKLARDKQAEKLPTKEALEVTLGPERTATLINTPSRTVEELFVKFT